MRESIRKGPGGCGNQNVFYFECDREPPEGFKLGKEVI